MTPKAMKTVEKALEAVRFIEGKYQKTVVGVEIKGTAYSLQFAIRETQSIPDVDNVTMG